MKKENYETFDNVFMFMWMYFEAWPTDRQTKQFID